MTYSRPSSAIDRPYMPAYLRAEVIGQENRIEAHMRRVAEEATQFLADDKTKDNLMLLELCEGCGELNPRVHDRFCSTCRFHRGKRK